MKRRAKSGFLLVAAREWRWLLHDRVALFLIFGVPLFTFVVLAAVFSQEPRILHNRITSVAPEIRIYVRQE